MAERNNLQWRETLAIIAIVAMIIFCVICVTAVIINLSVKLTNEVPSTAPHGPSLRDIPINPKVIKWPTHRSIKTTYQRAIA